MCYAIYYYGHPCQHKAILAHYSCACWLARPRTSTSTVCACGKPVTAAPVRYRGRDICKHTGFRVYRAGNGGQSLTSMPRPEHQVKLPKLGICALCLQERLEELMDGSIQATEWNDSDDSEDMETITEETSSERLRQFRNKLIGIHCLFGPVITRN